MNNQRRKHLAEIKEQISGMKSQLEELLQEEQDAFDGMPENLQESERGEKAQNAIGQIEEAISNLEYAETALDEAAE